MLHQPVRRIELAKALAQLFRHEVLIEVTQHISRTAGLLDRVEAVDRQLGQQGADCQTQRRADRLLAGRVQIPTEDRFFDETVQTYCVKESTVLHVSAQRSNQRLVLVDGQQFMDERGAGCHTMRCHDLGRDQLHQQ
ncbi:hypothetical protein D3C78_854660 [compost metagenome]